MHPRLLTLPVPEFNLLGLHFGPTITLHTYGLLLAIAFIAGLWVASREAKRQGLDAGRVTDMAIWVLIAGLIGAKVLLVLVDFHYYQRSPRELWSIFQSGGVFYGGLTYNSHPLTCAAVTPGVSQPTGSVVTTDPSGLIAAYMRPTDTSARTCSCAGVSSVWAK